MNKLVIAVIIVCVAAIALSIMGTFYSGRASSPAGEAFSPGLPGAFAGSFIPAGGAADTPAPPPPSKAELDAMELESRTKSVERYFTLPAAVGRKKGHEYLLDMLIPKPYKPPLGETLTLGSYPQNGKDREPIEWYVLMDLEGRYKLIASRYVLEQRPFQEGDEFKKDPPSLQWPVCSLRAWLNGDFYSEAFTPEEKKRIVPSRIHGFDAKCKPDGRTTVDDRVFILCKEEVGLCFPGAAYRKCVPTKHAAETSLFVFPKNGCTYWWMRGPGGLSFTCMGPEGFQFNPESWDDRKIGVRPAMWIKCE